MAKDAMKDFKTYVSVRMAELGIKQKELSKMVGVSEGTLSDQINGNPTLSSVNRIVDVLEKDFTVKFKTTE